MPSVIGIIYLLTVIIYVILAVLVIAGNTRENELSTEKPKVSVIVAARDEEENIAGCVRSLLNQDYPAHLLEIVIVNDRSGDNTYWEAEKAIGGNAGIKLINSRTPPENLTGKQNAMKAGIEKSSGDIILSTDADCAVPPGWISSMVKHFKDDTGLVAGFSTPGFSGWFSALQALDHIFLLSVASGFAGMGIPQSCIGNNIAFRREAYGQIGGYDGIGYTVTEDVGLLKKIVSETACKAVFNREQEALVKTKSANSFSELTRQRMRWLVGGYSASPLMLPVLTITFLSIVLSALTIVLYIPVGITTLCALALILFLGANLSILLSNYHFTGASKVAIWYLPYQLFFIIYSIYFGLLFVLGIRNVKWKGRIYR
ncbi:MAG: glycosyltransferase [candidate division Zixibacteria bacterium]|nr:glycosyltransferase [candidate division Zixibacteria bacterium]